MLSIAPNFNVNFNVFYLTEDSIVSLAYFILVYFFRDLSINFSTFAGPGAVPVPGQGLCQGLGAEAVLQP